MLNYVKLHSHRLSNILNIFKHHIDRSETLENCRPHDSHPGTSPDRKIPGLKLPNGLEIAKQQKLGGGFNHVLTTEFGSIMIYLSKWYSKLIIVDL